MRPTLDELLADMDRAQLQGLLVHLAARDAYLADEIESQIGLRQAALGEADTSQEGLPPRRTPVDPQPVRRQVRNILRSLDRMRPSEAYWHVGGVVDGVRQLLSQVQGFIRVDITQSSNKCLVQQQGFDLPLPISQHSRELQASNPNQKVQVPRFRRSDLYPLTAKPGQISGDY